MNRLIRVLIFTVLFSAASCTAAANAFAHGVVYDQKMVGENTLRVTLRWSDPGKTKKIGITSFIKRDYKNYDVAYEVSDDPGLSDSKDFSWDESLGKLCIRLYDVKNYDMPAFTDLKDHYAEPYIRHLHSAGIVNGKSDELFKPRDKLTRAEFMVMLVKSLGIAESGDPASNAFKDIDSHWAKAAILASVDMGLLTGYGDGTLRPDNSVTVAEACTIVSRAFSLKQVRNGIYEKLKQNTWYSASVKKVFDARILNTSDDIYWNFNEQDPISRADCCVMLSRALSL